MKCSEVYRHICDNLDQSLRTRRCREIRRHLVLCADCRAYLTSLKQTVGLYRSIKPPRLPKAAHDRLITALEANGCFRTAAPRTAGKVSRRKAR
jgi:hypothetical protein